MSSENEKKRGRKPRGAPGAPCPSCHRMCSLETSEPEVNSGPDVEFDGESVATVTAEVRVVRTSACCGEEIKETTLELSTDVDLSDEEFAPNDFDTSAGEDDADDQYAARLAAARKEHEHNLTVEETGNEITERSEGKGRYTVTYVGARLEFTLKCNDCNLEVPGEMQDDMQASSFDVLV